MKTTKVHNLDAGAAGADMKITTESGAVYEIDHGICHKTDHEGDRHTPFKVWFIKALPLDPVEWKTWDLLDALPDTGPIVGRRMYICGSSDWWISTTVVHIENGTEGAE